MASGSGKTEIWHKVPPPPLIQGAFHPNIRDLIYVQQDYKVISIGKEVSPLFMVIPHSPPHSPHFLMDKCKNIRVYPP